MRVCAKPVSPGRTTSRCQYAGISSQSSWKKRGRIGRGPTIDMSPRSTFQSWGTSSSCDARSQRPSPVTSVGRPLVELGAVPLAEPRLGTGSQRPELPHREDAAVAADPVAAVEDRAVPS